MAINLISDEKADELLTAMGYKFQSEVQSDYVDALEKYQRLNNLEVTGHLNNETERSLVLTRFCQLPEFITLNASALAKWPKKTLTWGFNSQATLKGFSRDDLIECFGWAFGNWAQVCNLSFSFSQSTNITPDIIITTGKIDSVGNTLAWSELPNGSQNAKLTQKFDNSERFVFSQNPKPGEIDLGAVATHEIGHAIGIEHISGNTGDLMNPFYSSKIRVPQKGDIKQATARYGDAPTVPIPPSVPLPPVGVVAGVISIPVTLSVPPKFGQIIFTPNP